MLLSFPPILEEESDYVCPFYSQPSGCDVNATGDAFRDKINEVVISESTHFVDINAEWVADGEPQYTSGSYVQNLLNVGHVDGVHPTALGADEIAEKVYTYMVANGLDNMSVVCVGDSITRGENLSGAGTATGDTYPARLYELLNQ